MLIGQAPEAELEPAITPFFPSMLAKEGRSFDSQVYLPEPALS